MTYKKRTLKERIKRRKETRVEDETFACFRKSLPFFIVFHIVFCFIKIEIVSLHSLHATERIRTHTVYRVMLRFKHERRWSWKVRKRESAIPNPSRKDEECQARRVFPIQALFRATLEWVKVLCFEWVKYSWNSTNFKSFQLNCSNDTLPSSFDWQISNVQINDMAEFLNVKEQLHEI